jgi:hypothetical protein
MIIAGRIGRCCGSACWEVVGRVGGCGIGGDCGEATARTTTASSRAVGRCRDEYSFRKRAGGTDRPGIGHVDRVGTGTSKSVMAGSSFQSCEMSLDERAAGSLLVHWSDRWYYYDLVYYRGSNTFRRRRGLACWYYQPMMMILRGAHLLVLVVASSTAVG